VIYYEHARFCVNIKVHAMICLLIISFVQCIYESLNWLTIWKLIVRVKQAPQLVFIQAKKYNYVAKVQRSMCVHPWRRCSNVMDFQPQKSLLRSRLIIKNYEKQPLLLSASTTTKALKNYWAQRTLFDVTEKKMKPFRVVLGYTKSLVAI